MRLGVALGLLFALAAPVRAEGAAPAGVRYATDRLVVVLEPAAARAAWPAHAAASRADARGLAPLVSVPTGLAALDAAAAALGARLEPEFPGEPPPDAGRAAAAFPLAAFWIARLPAGADPEAVRAVLAAAPGVARVERVAFTAVALDDSLASFAWHLWQPSRRDLHVEAAWPHARGEGEVIGVVDTGCLFYHPDLEGLPPGADGRFFANPAEAAGTAGVDDDGNGYVDDVRGWDFVHVTGPDAGLALPGEDVLDEDPDPNDMAAHGTAVAGVAAAIADNGIGAAGVAPRARILPLRAGFAATTSPTGFVDLSAAARAIRYATRLGVTVVNCSFSTVFQSDLRAAVEEALAAGVAVVFAGGNGVQPHYIPDVTRVIAVGATDARDAVGLFSTRGEHLDLCAPGANLPAPTVVRPGADSIGRRQPSYTTGATGSSFAAPMASAAIALLQEHRRRTGRPPLAPADLAFRLRETADDISAANPTITLYGAGRLNVERLLLDPERTRRYPFPDSTLGPSVVLPTLRGERRVLVTDAAGTVSVLDPREGAVVARWTLPARPVGAFAVAEPAAGRGPALFVALADGRLWGGRPNGDALPRWPVEVGAISPDVELPAPALGDLDGDGAIEVVWGAASGEVLAFRADGQPVPGFPRKIGPAGRNPPLALADLDGAPGVEIVALAPQGSVFALRGDGTVLWIASYGLQPRAPFVAPAGADGETLVVVAGDGVWAIRRDGRLAWSRYTVDQGPQPIAAIGDPIPADLDGDGRCETVVPEYSATLGGLAVLRPGGALERRRDLLLFPSAPLVSGPLRRGGGHGVLVADRPGEAPSRWLALDGALADVPGILWNEGRSGRFATFAELDGDDGMEILAGAADEGVLYAYDAGPATSAPLAGAWPTLRGNAARTGSTVYAPATGAWDDVAPAPVLDLVAESVEPQRAVVRWTAVADEGPDGRPAAYDLRIADTPIDAPSFALAKRVPAGRPGAPGDTMRVVALGTGENREVWFAVRALDAQGNASALSNVVRASTGGLGPAAIADLRVRAGPDSTLALRWTATGDDGRIGRPVRYRVRAGLAAPAPGGGPAPLVATLDATADAGAIETATLRPFDPARRWWVTIEAEDDAGNVSAPSNAASSLVRLGATAGLALAPRRQPATAPVELEWTADGPGATRLRVFDAAGRLVHERVLEGADGVTTWNGDDRDGRRLPPGVYHLLLERGAERARARVALLR